MRISDWSSDVCSSDLETLSGLNTPKSGNLDPIFKRFLGVPSISSNWPTDAQAVNDFVSVRGDIAHRGRDASYVKINKLSDYKALVSSTAIGDRKSTRLNSSH